MTIVLSEITYRIGGRVLFEGISTSFTAGKRYALTGPNGAGKSTLLKIITKELDPTAGTVSSPLRVGILKQNIEAFRDVTVLNTVIMGNKRLWEALEESEHLYEMPFNDDIGMRLGELAGVIAEEEGYSAESAAEELLAGMGIPSELYQLKMEEVPTDMQFRALICQSLFGRPEALLLDEPTNHLDLSSISWLENFLRNFTGIVIVVSHDRHFLNAVATHIADIDYETLIIYPGNYDEMLIVKSSVRERAEAEAKTKEKKVAQLKEFVARFGAGTRASQVQSRIREIDRLQPQDLKKSNIQRPYIRFPYPEKTSGQTVCRLENVSKAYDKGPVIRNFSLEILRGEKIGVIGNNGQGKTTLLKLMAGVLQPDSGKVELGHQALISYFPQNHSDVLKKAEGGNSFEWLRARKAGIYDQEIRSVLGKLLFPGEDAFKTLSALSGGESARLILGGMMLTESNFLILDEPNSHLDLEAVSALGWGLNEFKGTVVVASHDRGLIGQVATKIIALEEGKIIYFDGPLEKYLESKA